ncbi:hypothetical protein [Paraburkholderia aromaticivorans]|uniref:hypothetical protein n=1 Tax=Paraburkholderia aromaticivorans TaxID=2026199 RepID=UPI001FC9448A|nr:hypothetical protein [Paraburkholderia aromaticivorans]
MTVTARLLRFGKEWASPALASTLKLECGARLATADNLRLHDDVPVMHRAVVPIATYAACRTDRIHGSAASRG